MPSPLLFSLHYLLLPLLTIDRIEYEISRTYQVLLKSPDIDVQLVFVFQTFAFTKQTASAVVQHANYRDYCKLSNNNNHFTF